MTNRRQRVLSLALTTILLLLPQVAAAALCPTDTAVTWSCTPPTIEPCRETLITCTADAPAGAPGRFVWDLGDGGPPGHGARIERRYPAGLTGYRVRLTATRAQDGAPLAVAGDTLVLPLAAPQDAPADCPAGRAVPRPHAREIPHPGPLGLRVAVIADSNGPYGAVSQAEGVSAAVAALETHWRPDIVIHNGDMIAGQKRGIEEDQLLSMWAGYFDEVVRPLAAAGIPLLPVPGNHDASPAKGLLDRAVYAALWRAPENRPAIALEPGDDYPLRYAVRHRGAVFIVLDAPTGRIGRDDLQWLDRALGGPDEAPRFVFAHVPPWQPTERAYGTLRRWDELAEILRRRRVTALFSGHYEVFFPAVKDGIEVVISGALAAACAPHRDSPPGCRCRPLAGEPLCQGLSFLILDVEDGRLTRKFAVHGPEFERVFPAAWLPGEVNGHSRAPGWL